MTREEEVQMKLESDRAWHKKMQEESYARQAGAGKQETSKMGWGIFLIALLLCIIGDIIDAITVGTIGWLIGLVIDLILLIILGVSSAGRKQWKKWVTGLLGESIPIVSTLPLRTGFLIWSFISSRSTKLQAISAIASKIT